jgi:signal transduction histidine kinase
MEKIDRMLYERYIEMAALANDPLISSKTSTPGQISEKLKEYLDRHNMYASLSFFDMNRVRIADTTGKRLGEQHKIEDYWVDIVNGKHFAIDIHSSISLKKPAFHFASVVKDKKGTPIGVVVSRMPIDYLYNIVRPVSDVYGGIHLIDEYFKIELLDRNGLVLYSNYNLKGILSDISPNWEFVKKKLDALELLGSKVHQHLKEEEITSYINEPGYLSFAGNGWNLVISVSAKKALEPVLILKNKLIAIFSIAGIVILCSIVIFSRKLTRPLKTLHKASIEIGRGNLDSKINIASKDEIGQLAMSFNKMTSDLKKFKEEMLIHSSELENKVAERTSELIRINEQLHIELIERQRIEKVLMALKDVAEAANQAKSEFIANVNHELRTPLNSILGFSEVLTDEHYGSLNAQQKEYIAYITDSGKHLLSLINDLLDLSKIEVGMMQIELSRFLLKGAINSSVAILKEKANKHGIALSADIEAEADINIEADERKFKQIMFNLLSNALKFTPDGGSVQVTACLSNNVGATRWVVQEEGRGTASPLQTNFIEISVADTGIGIKEENMPELFKEFVQLDNAYTKKHKGTGLGLALTKKIVELHCGEIWVESEYGKRSTFTFTIPINTGQYVMECRKPASAH